MSSKSRLFLTLVAIALSIWAIIEQPTKLGLDLRGGTQLRLDLSPRPGQEITSDLAQRTLEVLRRRVDSLGVSEPNLSIENNTRILVELPGEEDPERAVQTLGSTAQLTVHPVLGQAAGTVPTTAAPATGDATPPTTTAPNPGTTATTQVGLGTGQTSSRVLGQQAPTTGAPATTTTSAAPNGTTTTTVQDQTGAITAADDTGASYSLGPAVITGDGIATAAANPPDQNHTGWYLTIEFKGEGAKAWTKLTADEACARDQSSGSSQSAFVLDGKIINLSGPGPDIQCNVGITGNTTEVTSSTYTQKEVQETALLIRGGALPVNVSVSSQQVVGPELGKAAINDSLKAVIIGGVLTMVYVILYYRLMGLLASVALACYAVISFAVLKFFGVTLTLPGIAALVLSIAMAMDSNVLVYERVKEEFANGRSMRQASQFGFKNALSAIIDSNATTFIAALTLFFFAIGEVRGFGLTLAVGTVVSIFVTMVILRTLVTGFLATEFTRNHPKAFGMYVGQRFRNRMSQNPPDVMKIAKFFAVIPVALVVFCLAGLFIKGLDYGIEFAGGRSLEYKANPNLDLDKAREEIAKVGLPQATVQRADRTNTVVRVKSLNNEQETQIEQILTRIGGQPVEKVQDTTIGPSFSDELKRDAVKGMIIGVGLQLLWVAYRFRWTFGVGAVVAMLHDAILVVGIFAWFGKEFNAVFLAAVLTIIAYSVNDTVVVFDRIREQRKKRLSESFARIVSDACAQTFPRTVNIGLSALFILGALYVLGGETLADFALALILGVVTGIYSSVMVAAPIAVLLERLKPSMSSGRPIPGAAKRQRAVSATSSDDGQGAGHVITTQRPNPRPRKKGKRR